jgi:hypothetical protein
VAADDVLKALGVNGTRFYRLPTLEEAALHDDYFALPVKLSPMWISIPVLLPI